MSPMISAHLEELRADGYSETTITLASSWLQNLQSFAGQRCLTKLGPKDLEQWHKQLTWTPGPRGNLYSTNTVNQAVGAARRFYRFLIAQGKLRADPTSGIRVPKPKGPSWKLSFTASQARQLLSAPDLDTPTGIRDRAVLGVLLETQIPRAACSRIDLAHLCFDTGALLSTGRSRGIHSLSDGLLADLERYLLESRPLLISLQPGAETEAFFLTVHGTRLTAPGIYQLLQRHRRHCGL